MSGTTCADASCASPAQRSLFVFFAIALTIASLLPVAPSLVEGIAIGIGSPLWVLSSFILAQALVPFLVDWHERRRVLTISILMAGALVSASCRCGCAAQPTPALAVQTEHPGHPMPGAAFPERGL